MQSPRIFALGVAFVALSAGTGLACSGDDNGGKPGGADGGNDGASSGATSGSSSGSGSGAGSGTASGAGSGSASGAGSGPSSPAMGEGGTGDGGAEGGEGGAVSCATYCAGVTATCTGANAQYAAGDAAVAECMNACAQLPLGMASDTSGNTIGCRTYHTMLAATTPNPHCWHAGPYGYGACGTEGAGFCAIAGGWCSADGGFEGAAPFDSGASCATACAAVPKIDEVDGG